MNAQKSSARPLSKWMHENSENHLRIYNSTMVDRRPGRGQELFIPIWSCLSNRDALLLLVVVNRHWDAMDKLSIAAMLKSSIGWIKCWNVIFKKHSTDRFMAKFLLIWVVWSCFCWWDFLEMQWRTSIALQTESHSEKYVQKAQSHHHSNSPLNQSELHPTKPRAQVCGIQRNETRKTFRIDSAVHTCVLCKSKNPAAFETRAQISLFRCTCDAIHRGRWGYLVLLLDLF